MERRQSDIWPVEHKETRQMSGSKGIHQLNSSLRSSTDICHSQTYKWGFSFIQLNLMIILLLLWSIGIFLMYVCAEITLSKSGESEVIGEYKAVFALANAVQAQLGRGLEKEEPSDAYALSENQIRRRITKNLNGGSMSLDHLPPFTEAQDVHRTSTSLKVLLRKEKWWLGTFAVMLAGVLVGVGLSRGLLWAFLVPVEMAFILYVGRSKKSRFALGFWAFWYFCMRSIVPIMMIVLVSVRRSYSLGFA
jgi:hypothetical protein